jgi:hypothetical protein
LVKESASIACELIHLRETFSCKRSRISKHSSKVLYSLQAGGAFFVATSKTDLQSVTALHLGAFSKTASGLAQSMLGFFSHSQDIRMKLKRSNV